MKNKQLNTCSLFGVSVSLGVKVAADGRLHTSCYDRPTDTAVKGKGVPPPLRARRVSPRQRDGYPGTVPHRDAAVTLGFEVGTPASLPRTYSSGMSFASGEALTWSYIRDREGFPLLKYL